jgi:hypothetical protein
MGLSAVSSFRLAIALGLAFAGGFILAPAEESALRQAEAIELEEQPLIPVLLNISRSLVSRRLHGWQDNVLDWHHARFMSIDN